MAPWDFLSSVTNNVKRRLGKTLMNKYLGEFLEGGTVLASQLTAEGDVSVERVSLNAARINQLLGEADLPLELLDGYIRGLSVSVPWSALLSEDCRFSVDGLTVTVQVKARERPATAASISASIFHSMCESFSPMHMAEDCLKSRPGEDEDDEERRLHEELEQAASQRNEDGNNTAAGAAKVMGVEVVAQAIDSVISRVRMTLKNTTVRLEFVPESDVGRGLALEVKVGTIMFAGGGAGEMDLQAEPAEVPPHLQHHQHQQRGRPRRYSRRLFMEGVTLHSDDFTFDDASSRIADSMMVRNFVR